ncbi:MAG: DUF5343 domain-containing protein [Pseudomonadota bacterium]
MAYPYVQSQDKFSAFLTKISTIGVPDAASVKWLQSIGFTSSNDERFLGALKYIGLVENKRGGSPTDEWRSYRANAGETLSRLLPVAYSDLYQTYPSAHDVDNEALASFFTANTDLGADAVARIVATFKTMANIADFENVETTKEHGEDKEAKNSRGKSSDAAPQSLTVATASRPTVNINIQLQLPPDASGDVYEKFFEAMKKSLYPDEQ